LVQGANITIASVGGNITISGTAAKVQFQINGSNASSQVLQNLIAGSGITISDGGGGAITIASSGGISLEVNGTPNGDQSLLNLVNGANVTITDEGSGSVSIAAAYPIFQVNSTPLTSSGTVNLQAGAGILITNPSAGNIQIAQTGSAVLTSSTLTLTAAEVLALDVTPIQLVPAPGAGIILVPQFAVYEFDVAGSPPGEFANTHSNDLQIYVNTTQVGNLQASSAGLIDQSQQTFETANASATNIFGDVAEIVNQPIMLFNNSSAYTGGGSSTLTVTVYYTTYEVV
jgi:hypothetical protein